jgi:hypothetical protein
MGRVSSSIRSTPHIEALCRVVTSLIGAFLFAAAISKTVYPEDTQAALGYLSGRLWLPLWVVGPAFWMLVISELGLGAMLIVGAGVRWALPATGVLLGLFAIWALFLWTSGAKVPCGCGIKVPWGGGDATPTQVLTRNVVLLSLLAPAYWKVGRKSNVEGATPSGGVPHPL